MYGHEGAQTAPPAGAQAPEQVRWEEAYVIHWYGGPRFGLTTLGGEPYLFRSAWTATDHYGGGDLFSLQRVPGALRHLGRGDWSRAYLAERAGEEGPLHFLTWEPQPVWDAQTSPFGEGRAGGPLRRRGVFRFVPGQECAGVLWHTGQPPRPDSTLYRRPPGVPECPGVGAVVLRPGEAGWQVAVVLEAGGLPRLPQGRVRGAEGLPAALGRKLAEDTGLSGVGGWVDLGSRERLDYKRLNWQVTRYFLGFTRETGEAPQRPGLRREWFPLAEVPDLFWPEQQQLLGEVRRGLERGDYTPAERLPAPRNWALAPAGAPAGLGN